MAPLENYKAYSGSRRVAWVRVRLWVSRVFLSTSGLPACVFRTSIAKAAKHSPVPHIALKRFTLLERAAGSTIHTGHSTGSSVGALPSGLTEQSLLEKSHPDKGQR